MNILNNFLRISEIFWGGGYLPGVRPGRKIEISLKDAGLLAIFLYFSRGRGVTPRNIQVCKNFRHNFILNGTPIHPYNEPKNFHLFLQ